MGLSHLLNVEKRLNELQLEFDRIAGSALLYLGCVDPAIMEIKEPNEINPNEVNMRDGVGRYFQAYSYGQKYLELADILLNGEDYPEDFKIMLRQRTESIKKFCSECETLVNYAISRLPNEFTFQKELK